MLDKEFERWHDRDAEKADPAGRGNAGDALGAAGYRQRQRGEVRDLGQHEGNHGEIDAAQPQDRQTDEDAGNSAEEPGERQAQPEGHAIGRHQDRRDVAADERIGALADVDPANIEGEPDAAARDRQQRDGTQRVIEVGPPGLGDHPGRCDEDENEKSRDRGDPHPAFPSLHRLIPTACPSARSGGRRGRSSGPRK